MAHNIKWLLNILCRTVQWQVNALATMVNQSIKASFSVCCLTFLKFSNKSHNMKVLIILHSSLHDHHFSYLLIYMEKLNFCWACAPFWGILMRTNTPITRELICSLDSFTKLSLSNIMKHGESDAEWQISIQGKHLSAFGIRFGKVKEALIEHDKNHQFVEWLGSSVSFFN